ncbi:methyltransferase [Mangrovihabitans endophyticus]|nr:methyltransferase [Mangrovihabitans endophyticus]
MSVDDTRPPPADEPGAGDDYDRMYQLIMGAWGSQVVRTMAGLSVADHLEAGPLTAEEIASRASADPDMTYRVLRAGVALGILSYDPDDRRFSGGAPLALLRSGSARTLKHYAQASAGPVFWGPALLMPETVARGRNHVTETLGCDVFEYFGRHPEDARLFSAGMTDLAAPVIDGAVDAIVAEDGQAVVDVGGANGALVCELLRRRPGLTGTVLDLPHVVPGAAEHAALRGLGDRLTATAGDFFAAVPPGDVVLLKHILHDWDDAACVRILSNVRAALRPGGRVHVIEMVMTPAAPSVSAALTDMAMLFATTGRERELPEYAGLLAAAGLRVSRVTPIHRPYAVIEAVDAG